MSIMLHVDPAPLRVNDTGAIRVGQSRVTLDVLLRYWRSGMKPEEIARGLDTLTLADVHGALAYYLRHQDEIDDYLHRREEEAEKLRRDIESANAARLAPLKARLDGVRAKEHGGHAPATEQELLGHANVEMTMIYTHMLIKGGQGVRSPLDCP